MPISAETIKYFLQNLPQLVFEVTDACNLRCKYCGYSDLYEGYDSRTNKMLDPIIAKKILDFLFNIWRENFSIGNIRPINIGFYGGEPLLNMRLIKWIVDYTSAQTDLGKKFIYNMTTNGILLKKYASYLVDNNFRLLISLDGDEVGQSYRVDASGRNSFATVVENISYIKTNYPHYFEKYVMFNSVLHNRNSVDSIFHFIKDNFGKEPTISPLSNSGIREDKKKEFNKTYRNYVDSIAKASNCEALKQELFVRDPETACILEYLYFNSGNIYSSYNSLFLANKETEEEHLTGTCIPFSKKMFVSVNGKILQCEKISQRYFLGRINESGVDMDLDLIAHQYNSDIESLSYLCKECGNKNKCTQCLYHIDSANISKKTCPRYLPINKSNEKSVMALRLLRKHPDLYFKLLRNAVIRG